MSTQLPTALSKSKLMACRQCARRLWLEWHHPELCEVSAASQAAFETGHTVGAIARRLYDPKGNGLEIGRDATASRRSALQQTAEALPRRLPLFEAGFEGGRAYAYADVLLPVGGKQGRSWRMVEVKSATAVKDYYRMDAAIQSYVARTAGLPLKGVAIAYVDKTWTYPGKEDYAGLLVEQDVTRDAAALEPEVVELVENAHATICMRKEPSVRTGPHCTSPYPCGFLDHCKASEPVAEYPVEWIPRKQRKDLLAHLAQSGAIDMRQVPDHLLNPQQQRVKQVTLSGKPYSDRRGAAERLRKDPYPHYFLDFETVQFAVPIWAKTRPYQKIPFQFSLHRRSASGEIRHYEFLDLSGNDPSRPLAEALVKACGVRGAIYAYNAGFEKGVLTDLARRFPTLRAALTQVCERIVDLYPIATDHYYHPDQQGSWSIKSVLPTLAPEHDYGNLDGVQDGGMAMDAFHLAIASDTSAAERARIEQELLAYCRLDTEALMVLRDYWVR